MNKYFISRGLCNYFKSPLTLQCLRYSTEDNGNVNSDNSRVPRRLLKRLKLREEQSEQSSRSQRYKDTDDTKKDKNKVVPDYTIDRLLDSDSNDFQKEHKDDKYKGDRRTRFAYRPKNYDPEETSIFLFPGQGSQFVGMGKKLIQYPVARNLYDTASDHLGYDLLDICLNGPQERLDKTEVCQPAVFVTSLASAEVLRETEPEVWILLIWFWFKLFYYEFMSKFIDNSSYCNNLYYKLFCLHGAVVT